MEERQDKFNLELKIPPFGGYFFCFFQVKSVFFVKKERYL